MPAVTSSFLPTGVQNLLMSSMLCYILDPMVFGEVVYIYFCHETVERWLFCIRSKYFGKCIRLCFISRCSLKLTHIHAEQHSNYPNRRCLKMNEASVITTESFHLFWFPAVILLFELYLITSWTRSDFWISYCISILHYKSSVHGEYFHISRVLTFAVFCSRQIYRNL